jgi:hypothetical protein
MMAEPLTPDDDFLKFYFYGFRSALLRYRRLAILGWLMTAGGCGGLLVSCRQASEGDLLAGAIPLCAVVAGLALVHQSVAFLDAYVEIPFPKPDPEHTPSNICAMVGESARWMTEIDGGGWQEAFQAIHAIGTMAERYGIATGR